MGHKIITFFLLLIILGNINGQEVITDPESESEISKLGFISGRWSGSGWMMGQDRMRQNFEQTEDVQFKLDGTAILIEGQGKSDGEIIHNALAIISFNKEDNNYTFQSYLSDGRSGKYKAELKEGKLFWYPADNIRYIVSINEQGQWYETGEINMNDQWYQFFEMTLDKK